MYHILLAYIFFCPLSFHIYSFFSITLCLAFWLAASHWGGISLHWRIHTFVQMQDKHFFFYFFDQQNVFNFVFDRGKNGVIHFRDLTQLTAYLRDFKVNCLEEQQSVSLATFGTVWETRLQLVGESPCPFLALLQKGVEHIWPPGRYGRVAAMEVGGHEHEKYPICHNVLSH